MGLDHTEGSDESQEEEKETIPDRRRAGVHPLMGTSNLSGDWAGAYNSTTATSHSRIESKREGSDGKVHYESL